MHSFVFHSFCHCFQSHFRLVLMSSTLASFLRRLLFHLLDAPADRSRAVPCRVVSADLAMDFAFDAEAVQPTLT